MNLKAAISTLSALMFLFSAGWTGYAQEKAQQPDQEKLQEPAQAMIPPDEITVPEGTVIPIVLTAFLNTKSSQVGDTFYADTTYPIWIQQQLIIPKGSTIRGTVTEVVRPGRIKGRGHLGIRFDDILLPNGVRRDFVAVFKGIHGGGNEKMDSKKETVTGGGEGGGVDAGTVVATSSNGAILGAIVDGGAKGAVIGAGAGAAVGVAMTLFGRGRDLVLQPGTMFELELKRPMKFAYNEVEFTSTQLNSVRREPAPPAPKTRSWGRQRTLFPGIIPLL